MAEHSRPRLLRAAEAAQYLGLSKRTLWTLSNQGKIPTVRFCTGGRGSVRYDLADLDDFIEAGKSGTVRGRKR